MFVSAIAKTGKMAEYGDKSFGLDYRTSGVYNLIKETLEKILFRRKTELTLGVMTK